VYEADGREREEEEEEKKKTSFLKYKNNIYMEENAILYKPMCISSPF